MRYASAFSSAIGAPFPVSGTYCLIFVVFVDAEAIGVGEVEPDDGSSVQCSFTQQEPATSE